MTFLTTTPGEIAAQRTAELCQAAEKATNRLHSPIAGLVYVIGTEVPTPGGVQAAHESMQVTQVETAEFTIETTRQAFLRRGLEGAWERVAAVVVQPGIEFADRMVFPIRSRCPPVQFHRRI
jgi:D-tagatose-1,6-bisphosphate aldolase subunit GatZ/KbaZ